MKAGRRKRDPHPLSQACAARRRKVHRSTIVGLSHVLFLLTHFCAGAGNLSAYSHTAGDGWTRSRAVLQATKVSRAKADFFQGFDEVEFTAPEVGARKKDSLRKFQNINENQFFNSNHSVSTVIFNVPENNKNCASPIRMDWKRIPGRKGGPMT